MITAASAFKIKKLLSKYNEICIKQKLKYKRIISPNNRYALKKNNKKNKYCIKKRIKNQNAFKFNFKPEILQMLGL